MRKALVTGITGQDGSYLAELLLSKGYEVHGLIRRASTFNTGRVDHLYVDSHDPNAHLFLYYGDLGNSEQLVHLIYNIQPDEIYHLGAQSHVRVSFDVPEYTGDITALGTTRLLQAILRSGIRTKFYQASSSECSAMHRHPKVKTPLSFPRARMRLPNCMPTGWRTITGAVINYLPAMESCSITRAPVAVETFVTRKITRAIARILAGQQDKLFLGNLKAKRDWGYAPEYVEAMWLLLQQETPSDYVIGTGESHSVAEFVEAAFAYAGLDWQKYVAIDPRYFRPNEVVHLRADSSKARRELGWTPKVSFKDLIAIMVDSDLEAAGRKPVGVGQTILASNFSQWHQWSCAVTPLHQNYQLRF